MTAVKNAKTPICIALIQWFITTVLQIDRLFFTYDFTYFQETHYFIVAKVSYLLFLLISWCFIFKAIHKIKSGDSSWTRGFFLFKVYICLMMAALLVLWPGTWAWDDCFTLERLSTYNSWDAWQHVLTGIYQNILLQVLPFPGGVIFLQNVIISLCVAFVVVRLEEIFNIRKFRNTLLDTFVKLLPFLLPPVLMYQFSGYRFGLYVHLELVMLVMLIGAWKDQKEWSIRYLLLFCFLCTVTATWRTESLFYIPFACGLLFLGKKSVLPNKKKAVAIVLLVVGFAAINKLQKAELPNSNYEIISLLRPCAEVVRAADPIEDSENLALIDKVVSVEIIKSNPDINGEALFWSYNVTRDYNEEDYGEFFKAFISLSLKYPLVVLEERWNLLMDSSGITGIFAANFSPSSTLFNTPENLASQVMMNYGWVANKPVFPSLRQDFINLLGCVGNGGLVARIFQRIVWNAVIPALVLIYVWFRFLLKRNWYLLAVFTPLLIRLPIVALTQPAPWFMYLLSFYFLGYVSLVYGCLIFTSNRKKLTEEQKNG